MFSFLGDCIGVWIQCVVGGLMIAGVLYLAEFLVDYVTKPDVWPGDKF